MPNLCHTRVSEKGAVPRQLAFTYLGRIRSFGGESCPGKNTIGRPLERKSLTLSYLASAIRSVNTCNLDLQASLCAVQAFDLTYWTGYDDQSGSSTCRPRLYVNVDSVWDVAGVHRA